MIPETRGEAAGFWYHAGMFFFSLVALFALGAIVASFIGVLVVRLNTGESFLAGRSRCDACARPLSPLALVPIVSYLLSRGRAMGLADAPLAFGLALLTGPAALSGFVFSFWIGAAIGITILARRPRGSRMGVEVPFAPYLAAGFLLAYFIQWNPFAIIAATSLSGK